MPAVFNGLVIVNGSDGILSAFNVQDGTQAWVRSIPTSFETLAPAIPVVDGGVVYTMGNTGQFDGFRKIAEILAFDAASGDPLWTVRQDGLVWWDHPPLVSEGVLVAQTAPNCIDICIAGGTAAYDAKTGARRWLLDPTFPHTLAASNGNIFATGYLNGVDNGTIVAYRLGDGAMLWSTQSTSEPYRGLAVDGRSIYAANNGGVEAFSISNCATTTSCPHEWVSLVSGQGSAPAVSNGVLYVTHVQLVGQSPSTTQGVLDAIDAHTGQRLLRNIYGPDVNMDQPVVANGSLFFSTQQPGPDGRAHNTVHKLSVPNSSS